MALPARRLAPASESTDAISAFLRDFSIEATFPKLPEIEDLKRYLPQGTKVYLSCLPNRVPARLVEYAVNVRNAGFEPVPHLTARAYDDRASLHRIVRDLVEEAGVRSALVIAGDRDEPVGPFEDALDLIESGALEECGVTTIDIAGYPDGHPKITDAVLQRSLERKLEVASTRGLIVGITTQFCLDAALILNWLRTIRAGGVTVPVRIGVAGPTTMRSLMNFALRCGVRASLKGVFNPKALQLFGEAAPDNILRTIAEADDRVQLGPLAVHYFSFGGIVQTAIWAESASEGRFELTRSGFRIT